MSVFSERRVEGVRRFYRLDPGEGEVALLFLGLSGILIRTSKTTLAIDPADLLGEESIPEIKNLDILLYTHGHYDHYNRQYAIDIVKKTGAKVLAESKVYYDLKDRVAAEDLFEALSGKTYKIDHINVETVRGVHVGPIILYIIDIEGIRIFHGGDSGYTELKDYIADLALVPTGSPSPTASPDDAFKIIADLKPKVAVPIHGSKGEHDNFKRLVEREAHETLVKIIEEFDPVILRI
jgi:L-ascorbate metabolism protein UlaG (beta-lactamase superfamily)